MRAMETEALFEFTCPECEKGTVRTTHIHNYKTKIKGYPFTVDEALIGVCDECKAQSFAPEETQRWDGAVKPDHESFTKSEKG